MSAQDLRPHGIIVDEDAFAFVAALQIRQALRLQYPVSALAIFPDVESDPGPPDPAHLIAQLARVISPIIRSTDLIRLQASAAAPLHVLLIGAHLEDLEGVIRRITEEIGCHLFQVNGARRAITLRIGGSCFPTTAGSAPDLLAQARIHAGEARRDRSARPSYRLATPPAASGRLL